MTLWPDAARAQIKVGPDREIHQVYPTAKQISRDLWYSLVSQATRELTICHYSPYWLKREVRDFEGTLRRVATSGTRIRFVTGDPDNPIVAASEAATGNPLPLSMRIRAVHHMLHPLKDVVEVRQNALGYGRSVLRSDDQALMNWWLYAGENGDYPSFHVRRHQDGGMFDQLLIHLERLWDDATPVWE